MAVNILVADSQYEGGYVAMQSFQDKQIIAHGECFAEAYDKAVEKGVASPVVFFVPEANAVHIF